jgi:hypothetical protein
MTVLPQLKRDLFDAARATLPEEGDPTAEHTGRSKVARSVRHQLPRPSAGRLVATLSVGVAIATAALSLVLLGRHHETPTPATQGPSSLAQLERNPAIRQAIDHFAVLRRPQTAADRSWAAGQRSNPQSLQQVIPTLTRLARTIDGKRIFLTIDRVSRLAGRPGGPAQHAYVLTVALVDGHDNVFEAPYNPNVGDYTIVPGPLAPNSSLSVSVIPDGVSKVRWVYRCPPAGTESIVGPAPGHAASCSSMPGRTTIYPPIRGNVAAADVPISKTPATVTWYDRTGNAILVWNRSKRSEQHPKPFPGVQP